MIFFGPREGGKNKYVEVFSALAAVNAIPQCSYTERQLMKVIVSSLHLIQTHL